MNTKFWYMKILGFLITIIGFSYSLTSLYNFFDIVFENKIMVEGSNIFIMCLGIVFALFIFVFGVFFYFYADVYKNERNKLVLISIIIMFIISVFNIFSSTVSLTSRFFNDLVALIHPSFGYVNLILGVLLVYGYFKYKY